MEEKFYNNEAVLRTAINRIIKKEPFWARLLSCLKINTIKGIGESTLINGLEIFISEKAIESYSKQESTKLDTSMLESFILGAVMKIGLLHGQRRGDRIHEIWDAACNGYVVNLLNSMNYPLPKTIKEFQDEINLEGVTEEEIYEKLLESLKNTEPEQIGQKKQKNKSSNSDSDSNNSGESNNNEESGSNSDSNNSNESDNKSEDNSDNQSNNGKQKKKGKNSDSTTSKGKKEVEDLNKTNEESQKETEEEASGKYGKKIKEFNETMGRIKKAEENGGKDEAEQKKEQKEIENIINQIMIAAQQAGNLPGFYKEKIKSLRKTKFSLHKILEDFVVKSIEPNRYNWQKPNRRYMGKGIFYPTVVEENIGGILVAFDTSGSCFHEIKKLLGIILEIKELYCGSEEPIHILYCDTEVHHQIWKGEEILEPTGGGGTSYEPVMQWVKEKVDENPEQFTCLLYLTDGECYNCGNNPGIPVIWFIINIFNLSEEQINQRIHFGKKIIVSKKEIEEFLKNR